MQLYLPMNHQGLPAALAFEGYGKFQDSLKVKRTIAASPAAFNQRLRSIIDQEPRLPVPAMIDSIGQEFVKYLSQHAHKMSLSEGSTEASKLITLNRQNGSKSKTTILILEGRAERGVGSDPALAILHHYNQYFHSSKGSSGWANTYMPAIGVEIIGTEVRIHALYFTDRALIEPLTGWMDYAGVQAQPQDVDNLARTMQAVGELSSAISKAMARHT